jgi:hypothetical protein
MIDTATIRDNYASMLDSQLISIAQNDGHQLTPEAFQILKEEFKKRNLDASHIESAEETKSLIHQEKIQRLKESASDDFFKTIWKYILEEKEKGTPDSEIKAGLQERGLDESNSIQLLSTVKDKLKETVDSCDTKMLVGGATCVIGIFITLWTYSSAMSSGGTYVVAWGAIIFGGIRFFSGMTEKGKFKRILENIESKEPILGNTINNT